MFNYIRIEGAWLFNFICVMAIGESLLNGALGVIGTGIQIDFEKQQAQQEREWNEAMMDKQNQWTLDMWNRTNQYNSPLEQRKRLEEAGLNPLYYGLDGSSAGQVESAQALGYQRASMSGMDNPLTAGLQSALIGAQIEKTRAESAKIGEETTTEVTRRQEMATNIDKTLQEIQDVASSMQLKDSQRIAIEQTIGLLEREKQANIAYTESQTELNKSTKNRIDSLLPGEVDIQNYTLNDFIKNWERIDAEIKKISAETDILYEDLANYALNHYTTGVFGSGVSITNLVRSLIGLDSALKNEGRDGQFPGVPFTKGSE